ADRGRAPPTLVARPEARDCRRGWCGRRDGGGCGATVAAVARRHEISRQHIYQWRREMRLKGKASFEPAHFLPVELSPDPAEGGGGFRSTAGGVEIGLRNGRVVRVAADLPETQLMRLIRIAESA